MTRRRILILFLALVFSAALLPMLPAVAIGFPKTLADNQSFGQLSEASPIENPDFPVDYLGVSWTSGHEPFVRFLTERRWTAWRMVHEDETPLSGGRTFSSLIAAADADAYQVRGSNRDVRAVAINTTDGPREWSLVQSTAEASHISQPGLITRAQWGADESLRFNTNGNEIDPQQFHPTTKIILHHTAGQNGDPDPAATVRAIYRYHAIDRKWGDIGYNFLIDAQGRIYKGRYSGPVGTRDQDSLTGEDPFGYGVRSRQAGGHPGTVGISVLGTYTSGPVPAAARASVVDHVAWEAERHGLDPLGTSVYTDPSNPGFSISVANISGHRDWAATECPGGVFYSNLPAIRSDAAGAISAAPPQIKSYSPTAVRLSRGTTSDAVSKLAHDDSAYFRVNSVKPTSSAYIVDWTARATVGVSRIRKLFVTFDGSATRAVTQTLYIYRVSSASWEKLHGWQIPTSDQTFKWSTTRPARYITSEGTLKMRAKATRTSSSFVLQGDLVSFTVEY
ncbi:MAG TPA: peptidoglycan recognition family protein [Actinomycetota bacterium]|nr:peptidoglycan recognition family protein [Actinomycetota bacterium]